MPFSPAKDQTPESLGRLLDGMLQELATDVALIGKELAAPAGLDVAVVTRAIGRIVQLSHRFVQFMPRVAAARKAQLDAQGELSPQDMHKWGQLNSKVYSARTWINAWPGVEALVRSQVPPKRHHLFAAPDPITRAQNEASDAIFDGFLKLLNPANQDADAEQHGCFADISLSQTLFIALIHAAHRVALAQNLRHPPSFLDVGCGGGTKVLSARQYFALADGLEYDPGYVAAARDLFRRSGVGGCEIIHADGLTHQGYDRYDVIYFYRPMRDMELLRQLEDQILGHARQGTLILAPYKMFEYRFEELGCAHVAGHLYIKGLSQTDATALAHRAELVGPASSLKQPGAASLWDPILDASRRNGYAL